MSWFLLSDNDNTEAIAIPWVLFRRQPSRNRSTILAKMSYLPCFYIIAFLNVFWVSSIYVQ